jgi:2-keto-3-deoxy-L-fuconate dehydrogenase
MLFDLNAKVALVTGAGSGIGAAIAETYARAHARVYVTDRDEKAGRDTLARIRAAQGEAEFLRLDVTSEADCLNAAEHVERLDILVNNAGIGHVGTLLTTDGEDLDRLYRAGVIINLASIGGVVGVRDRLAYCTTKFAVVGITKSMALDHSLDGVRVNCICPGRVETPFVQARLREYPDPEAAYREMAATQALGRMGKPAEIAAAALYLASDEASFVTGTAFMIDGGWSAGK